MAASFLCDFSVQSEQASEPKDDLAEEVSELLKEGLLCIGIVGDFIIQIVFTGGKDHNGDIACDIMNGVISVSIGIISTAAFYSDGVILVVDKLEGNVGAVRNLIVSSSMI